MEVLAKILGSKDSRLWRLIPTLLAVICLGFAVNLGRPVWQENAYLTERFHPKM